MSDATRTRPGRGGDAESRLADADELAVLDVRVGLRVRIDQLRGHDPRRRLIDGRARPRSPTTGPGSDPRRRRFHRHRRRGSSPPLTGSGHRGSRSSRLAGSRPRPCASGVPPARPRPRRARDSLRAHRRLAVGDPLAPDRRTLDGRADVVARVAEHHDVVLHAKDGDRDRAVAVVAEVVVVELKPVILGLELQPEGHALAGQQPSTRLCPDWGRCRAAQDPARRRRLP